MQQIKKILSNKIRNFKIKKIETLKEEISDHLPITIQKHLDHLDPRKLQKN